MDFATTSSKSWTSGSKGGVPLPLRETTFNLTPFGQEEMANQDGGLKYESTRTGVTDLHDDAARRQKFFQKMMTSNDSISGDGNQRSSDSNMAPLFLNTRISCQLEKSAARVFPIFQILNKEHLMPKFKEIHSDRLRSKEFQTNWKTRIEQEEKRVANRISKLAKRKKRRESQSVVKVTVKVNCKPSDHYQTSTWPSSENDVPPPDLLN